MKNIKILINKTPPSLNTMLGQNRFKLANMKKEWALVMMYGIPREHKNLNIRKCKMMVTIRFANKTRRDYDNFIGGLKYLIDPLVEHKVLIDDSCNVITSFKVKIELGTLKKETEIKIIY